MAPPKGGAYINTQAINNYHLNFTQSEAAQKSPFSYASPITE
jgi:hypothetical protein